MHAQRLIDVAPDLEHLLIRGDLPPPIFAEAAIRCETVQVGMRDGVRLATDLYLPPVRPAPVIALRTPVGRDMEAYAQVATMHSLARRGYVVVSQDCRGTGDSEPDSWDYTVYESEDGYDLVEWISKQEWFGGFVGGCGGSYLGQMQWCMARHPAMSAILPSMSGLGIAVNTAHLYMFLNTYALAIGKGEDKVAVHYTEMERYFEKETLAGGYFNEPLHKPFSAVLLERFPDLRALPPSLAQRWLWEKYCAMTSAERAEFIKHATGAKHVTIVEVESLTSLFGHWISHDAHTIPQANKADLCRSIQAPPLLRTGWYDWGLNDALATFELLRREGRADVARRTRLIITPRAHNTPGYRESSDKHPELVRDSTLLTDVGLLTRWYGAVRENKTDDWPTVIYYLMGANEWRVASDWPVPEARRMSLYLGSKGTLTEQLPLQRSEPDRYVYDPNHPTPTVGGSIVSFLYTPGSCDVGDVQKRKDVLVYTTAPLQRHLDVVGPVRMFLYASSSARDTDFAVRLCDVFPDGRAIQLQHCMLRARYRDTEPELLEPGRVYCFEIDLWATANRFETGHRIRVDIASADFPKFDRNSNRGGESGDPIPAHQTIYHDLEHPSHLLLSVLEATAA